MIIKITVVDYQNYQLAMTVKVSNGGQYLTIIMLNEHRCNIIMYCIEQPENVLVSTDKINYRGRRLGISSFSDQINDNLSHADNLVFNFKCDAVKLIIIQTIP